MSGLTIPVQIDDIKRLKGFQRTRCNYFRIEFPERSFEESFPVSPADKLRVAAWGNWAVLTGPITESGEQRKFLSSDSIRQTFLKIEENEAIFLDLGYIYLPNQLLGLDTSNHRIRIGDVYRLSTELFQKCYLFVAEMISEKEWMEYCSSSLKRKNQKEIIPSPDETKAFRKWRKEQIKRSYDRYHEKSYQKHQLPRRREK